MNIFKKSARLACFGLAFGFCANIAYAAPYIPGGVQLLEDQDAEILMDSTGAIIDIDGSTNIAAGNLFAGVFTIQLTKGILPLTPDVNLQGHTETFTAIFLISTTSVTSTGGSAGAIDGSNDTLLFDAATQAQWDAVYGAGGTIDISSAFDVSDINGSGSGVATGTMAMLFNGVFFDEADADGLVPATQTLTGSATSFVDGGTLQYEFGIIDDGLTPVSDQFWSTIGTDAAFPALTGTNNPTNRFALNITERWAGPRLELINFLGTSGFDGHYTGDTHIQAKGDFAGVLGPDSPWGLGTDTDLYIYVPEPTNLALIAIGLISAGLSRRFKK
ncbi:MAG: PEP-CTERM sorting domain-containing protein [Methyloprofundus sp.]|nr:PEP-CTERM sorting domain-containing protein [Methyloprofundus sp.]